MKNQIKTLSGIALSVTMLFTSCRKEINTNLQQSLKNAEQNESVSALYNPFGVFVIASASNQTLANTTDPTKQYELTYANKIALSKDYGVKYIRQHVYEDKWTDSVFRKGFLMNFYSATSNGIKVLLNVMAHPIDGKAYPFPDATAYGNMLKNILDTLNAHKMKPELIVVENEEANVLYHQIDQTSQTTINASMQLYVNELTTAVGICKSFVWWDGQKGVKVTNGGFTTRAITYDTWYWLYYAKKDTAAARTYAVNAITPTAYDNIYRSLKYNGAPPSYIMSSVNTDEFLRQKYEPLGLSFINIHWYEPAKTRGWNDVTEGGTPWAKGISQDSTSKNVLETSIAYFAAMFTPKIISNEVGQITTSSNITRELCNKILKRQSGSFYYAAWMDADGNSDYDKKALHNTFMNNGVDSYTLRPMGSVFRQANASRN